MRRVRPSRPLWLVVFVLTLGAIARAGDERRGTIVAIGGGKIPDAVWDRFVELSGARQGGLLLVCPSASERVEGPEVDRLKKHGARAVEVLDFRSRADAQDPARVARLDEANGVFFTGGDQRRLLDVLDGTPALEALRRAFAKGCVVAGTSAGCAVLGELAIAGDGDSGSIAPGATPTRAGLGLVPGVVFDQHFLARRRHNRLVSVLRAKPGLLGVGVDEGTAVVRAGDGPLEVLGDSVASVYRVKDTSIEIALVSSATKPFDLAR